MHICDPSLENRMLDLFSSALISVMSKIYLAALFWTDKSVLTCDELVQYYRNPNVAICGH